MGENDMAALVEKRNGSTPNLMESGSLSGVGQTAWMPLVGLGEHVFTCDIEDLGSASGTFVVETRRVRGDDSVAATRTIFSSSNLADFPQIGRLAGWWEVRLRCSVYGGGSFNLSINQ
jgi:hypothetical protein